MDSNDQNLSEGNFNSWNEYISSLPIQKDGLITLTVNIRSMLLNFSTLEHIITNSQRCIDIIVLCEVNIGDTIKALFELPNYIMYTNLRKHRRGGGVIVYIHKNLTLRPHFH